MFMKISIYYIRSIVIVLPVILFSCSNKDEFQAMTLDSEISALGMGTLSDVDEPLDNISTDSKYDLGRALYFDPIMSGNKDVSCATCHHPQFGYTDGLDLSIGVGGTGTGPDRTGGTLIKRNAPTIINSAYNGQLTPSFNLDPKLAPMFWDNRALSLENQALGPPTSPEEMAGGIYAPADALDSIVNRLKNIQAYIDLFDAAFPEAGTDAITQENIGKAIAVFERTIVAHNSPYDKYIEGDESALSQRQKEGLLLFAGKANCIKCHRGPMFSDYELHVLGVEENEAFGSADVGNGSFAFRTPTLRNLSVTGPYMHNGTHATLSEVVTFYDEGVSRNENVSNGELDREIFPLDLTEDEKKKIVEFMEALNDYDYDTSIPSSVPSGLSPIGQ